MKINNLFRTKGGFKLSNLIINESKTVLLGKITFANDEVISTKWDIDRENKICRCRHESLLDLDICIKENYMAPEIKAVLVKNFYTFKKDAWHCKLYKWIFGKEPHKVHPTMCPYFWIMVLVLTLFPIILIVKLFGKSGVAFLNSCSTYKTRMQEQQRQKLIDFILSKNGHFSYKEVMKIIRSKKWDEIKYNNGIREVKDDIYEAKYLHEHEVRKKNEIIENEKRELRNLKWIEENELAKLKSKNRETRANEIKDLSETKTVKIIGILLIIIISAYALYGLSLSLIYLVRTINWTYVIYGMLFIAAFCVSLFIIYYTWKYVIGKIISLLGKLIGICLSYISDKGEECFDKVNLPNLNIRYGIMVPVGDGIAEVFKFLFGWVLPLCNIILNVFIYTANFFLMIKDLIHSMYKKNCPRITWTDENK